MSKFSFKQSLIAITALAVSSFALAASDTGPYIGGGVGYVHKKAAGGFKDAINRNDASMISAGAHHQF